MQPVMKLSTYLGTMYLFNSDSLSICRYFTLGTSKYLVAKQTWSA